MIKLLAGLFLWGAATAAQNKKTRETNTRAMEIRRTLYYLPEDPIPQGVVDIESWKWDIEHFEKRQINEWYRRGKYRKIIKQHPLPVAKIIDWNMYERDKIKFKDDKIYEGNEPSHVYRNRLIGLYQCIWEEDEHGNFTGDVFKKPY